MGPFGRRILLALIVIFLSQPAVSAVAPTAFTIKSPANGAAVSGTITIKGTAGSDWVNVRAYYGFTAVSADDTPSSDSYTLTINTSEPIR
jgi:hypothetical protein